MHYTVFKKKRHLTFSSLAHSHTGVWICRVCIITFPGPEVSAYSYLLKWIWRCCCTWLCIRGLLIACAQMYTQIQIVAHNCVQPYLLLDLNGWLYTASAGPKKVSTQALCTVPFMAMYLWPYIWVIYIKIIFWKKYSLRSYTYNLYCCSKIVIAKDSMQAL